MYAVILIAVASFGTPNMDGVCLTDAGRFPVDRASCRAIWKLTCTHPGRMVDQVATWNTPDALQAWREETHWRERCWNFLDDVLYMDWTPDRKLQSLARLRALLGDEAYFAGWMPAPFPNYNR